MTVERAVTDESRAPGAKQPGLAAGELPDGTAGGRAGAASAATKRSPLAWFGEPRHLLPFVVSKGTPLFAVLFLGLHGGDVLLLYLLEGMLACIVFACIWPRGAEAPEGMAGAMLVFFACLGGVIGVVLHNEYDYVWTDAAERLAVPAAMVATSVVVSGVTLAFPWAGRRERVAREFGLVTRMVIALMLLLVLAPFAVGLHPIGTAALLILIDAGLTVLMAEPASVSRGSSPSAGGRAGG